MTGYLKVKTGEWFYNVFTNCKMPDESPRYIFKNAVQVGNDEWKAIQYDRVSQKEKTIITNSCRLFFTEPYIEGKTIVR